ncbi:MAG: membrane protein insertion efficiency factor YidD [Candidatus Omnitrophica bacterium]|nr:membrane protein insertion efficiency factor YidD [Candidatus Omnitrophota bacterium]
MLKRIAVLLIKGYQAYVRRVLPPSCRFVPSCSEYVKQAIEKYGLLKGSLKGARRISACHPFSGRFGYDPLD